MDILTLSSKEIHAVATAVLRAAMRDNRLRRLARKLSLYANLQARLPQLHILQPEPLEELEGVD